MGSGDAKGNQAAMDRADVGESPDEFEQSLTWECMEGRKLSNSPNEGNLARALWVLVMSQGGSARLNRTLEQDFNSQHVLAKLDSHVDPITGETILTATAEPRARKGILRAALARAIGGAAP